MDFLKANYHAHTWRCQHAYDTEREYIEAAISMGIEIFGFSDHVPCPYQDGYVSNIRMTMKQAPEYVETIRRLEADPDRINHDRMPQRMRPLSGSLHRLIIRDGPEITDQCRCTCRDLFHLTGMVCHRR